MPRWASRITLLITDVEVQRVQDISERDCIAEGIGHPATRECKRPRFIQTWDAVYAARGLGYDANPWVWMLKFEKVPT